MKRSRSRKGELIRKKKPQSGKPAAIIELERIYNIKLEEDSLEYIINHKSRIRDFFAVGENNSIIALSITNHNGLDLDHTDSRIFKDLVFLSLTRSNITQISSIWPLPNLKYCYLGGNKVKNLKPLLGSPLIEELAIWGNPIEDFSPLKSLPNLKGLYSQDTGMDNIDFVVNLKKLQRLYVSINNINQVDILEDFHELQELHIDNNNIKSISKNIARKYNWLKNIPKGGENIDVSNNPLEFPPMAVVELGEETVEDYYKAAETYGRAPLSEGRIIVVGDGSAGKSSLIERVLYNTFEQGKSQTNGIFIENWKKIHNDKRNLTFHIWDFGGQEIQHAVHKFFFTEGCLYVLVLDNRKEEEPEYWLQQIESLGGRAQVLVVFNKQDDNVTEIADRKFLKEKYPNIVGFYNTSCKTGFGISDFKADLEQYVTKLRTVEEQFPNNWFKIKKAIEECTSGDQHYLDYKTFSAICNRNKVYGEKTQKLLLKYFTTIGAVTWFGDTYLNFLHVLSPKWITQGVYKIITSKKTAKLFGIIDIDDFDVLLEPSSEDDYIYEPSHYGYILSMMKKFDLCYTPDDKSLLIPSAFGKVPKMEYSDFRGDEVSVYILQFKDYMPLALIHRFTAKKLALAYENNYWYSGIVINDIGSDSIAMIHADKEAKRIYVRIKGTKKLGMWEHIRREFNEITSSYAQISYVELVAIQDEYTVAYEDLLSHLSANKSIYFHSKLQRDFNVGYLIGLFESKEQTIENYKKKEPLYFDIDDNSSEKVPHVILNILNNNSPQVTTEINNQINIDIDINIVNNLSSKIRGEAEYLLDELKDSNENLRQALNKIVEFTNDAKSAKNSGSVVEKGWGRKLKSVIRTLSKGGENLKNIDEGAESLKSILTNLHKLAIEFGLNDIKELLDLI